MAGTLVAIEFHDDEVRAALKSMAGMGRRALQPIGAALVKGTLRRFRAGQDPSGHAWAPLHPLYAPIKRGPGILRASRMLMRSITFVTGTDEVKVGSNRIYARIHQFGGVIVPKKAQYLRFRLSIGFVRAKKVTMPARPYLGVDREDEQSILDVFEALMAKP